MHRKYLLKKAVSQQLGMLAGFMSPHLIWYEASHDSSFWTGTQALQGALPPLQDFFREKHLSRKSKIIMLGFERDSLQSTTTEAITSGLSQKRQKQVPRFLNLLQSLPRGFLYLEDLGTSLRDANTSKYVRDYKQIALYCLIDSRGDSTISKGVEQLEFTGLKPPCRGKHDTQPSGNDIPSHLVNKFNLMMFIALTKTHDLIDNSFLYGLDLMRSWLIRGRLTRDISLWLTTMMN